MAEADKQPNFLNRTLWVSDNLPVLRGIDSETVDLIYLDPPFNSKRLYNAPLGSPAAGAKFDDTWRMDGVKSEWAELQEAADPALHHTVVGAGLSAGESMQAYLTFMALRLAEMRRVLKPGGSLYLHCDPHASHYLKQLLDCVFGQSMFRNEIIWCYRGGGAPKTAFARKHDTILRYSVSQQFTFHKQYVEYSEASKKLVESRGGVSIDDKERDLERGASMPDWWTDINSLQTWSPERTGWPTQKPLALLRRIIEASSNPGDMVLDPFCGCATTMVAAEQLGRQWAGIDIDEVAVGITQKRLQEESDAAVHNVDLEGMRAGLPTLHLPPGPPQRTDPDRPTRSPRIRQIRWSEMGSGDRRPCPGCGLRKYEVDFELDHVVPRSKGGLDADENLQLLCSSCNRIKGWRLTMGELREELRHR